MDARVFWRRGCSCDQRTRWSLLDQCNEKRAGESAWGKIPSGQNKPHPLGAVSGTVEVRGACLVPLLPVMRGRVARTGDQCTCTGTSINRSQYVPVQAWLPVHQYLCVLKKTLLEETNLTTGQKLTRHDVFTSFWGDGRWWCSSHASGDRGGQCDRRIYHEGRNLI